MQSYKILPGTSLVMGFQYSGKMFYEESKASIPLATAGITGLRDTFRIFTNSQNIGTVLVHFSETGASHFFKIPVHELFDESLALDLLLKKSDLEVFEAQLCEAKSDLQRIECTETFLLSLLHDRPMDAMVAAAIELIKKSNGTIRITELAEKLNISQSPLEKRFRKTVGATPKKFASIVRIQNTLTLFDTNKPLTAIALDSGYFDQSHFIKDFKSATGSTPEEYLRQIADGK